MGMGYLLIVLVFMGIGAIVQGRLKSKFKKYGKIPLRTGLSGKEVAEKMLHDNNLYDVQVISVPGKLTDHYDPNKKTVNLSADVYHGRNVSAAAVAAHECGHAVQHAKAYSFLEFRSAMVPLVNISSQMLSWIFLIGMFLSFTLAVFSFNHVILVVIAAQAVITIFTLVTLPVEFDASNRALAWLNTAGLTQGEEHAGAKDALKWAAMTYVVAALAALTSLAYYIMLYLGRRD